MSDVPDKKWFINEEGVVYDYDPATQEDDFPGDDHVAYDSEAEAQAVVDSEDEVEDEVSIPLARAEISFMVKVSNVETLGEAMDVAALQLMRSGLDSFYVLAVNPDTGEEWVMHDGRVQTAEAVETEYREAMLESERAVAPE